MTKLLPAHRAAKDDRNSHETSADESRDTTPISEQKRGGGHRSGSSGSGTLEEDVPRQVHDHARGP